MQELLVYVRLDTGVVGQPLGIIYIDAWFSLKFGCGTHAMLISVGKRYKNPPWRGNNA